MKFVSFFLSIVISLCSSGQRSVKWTLDELSNITVILYQEKGQGKSTLGSATIITDSNRHFLLTAWHVAKDMEQSAKIVFRAQGDKPATLDLLLLSKEHDLNWRTHPIADLAMLEIKSYNRDVAERLRQWSLPSTQIFKSQDLPARGRDISFLGFPIIDLDLQHFSPLTFSCYRSSGLITQNRLDYPIKCSFFYLNEPSMQGCSGSGVYDSVKLPVSVGGDVTVMIGVVHGTAGDNTGGKLAMITPAFYIWDLIAQFK